MVTNSAFGGMTMRIFLTALVLTLSLSINVFAIDETFVGGSAGKLLLVNMYDTGGLAKTGLVYSAMTITYTRNNGSADVDITEATMTMGTWVSGGWIEVDATNSPGLYQFGIPDAAIADGAESVVFSFKAASTFQRVVHASLVDVDMRNGANVAANTVQIEGVDATNQINAEADTALADYDAPTNAEMVARTLTSASYATASALATAQADITSILADTAAMDTSSEIRTLLTGSNTALATGTAQATAQADLDTLTGADGVTLATLQPNYAPNTTTPPTAGAIRTELETAGGHLALILEDTGISLPSTLSGLATGAALSTAQSDLDTLTGSDGATLATTQPNYAPYIGTPPTASEIRTELESAGTKLTLALADTDELQTRLGNMIEADGINWRFTANALEQGPTGGGGGGGDATAANQLTIIDHLEEMKGATFDAATDSLEAIRDHGDSAWGSGGAGAVPVNHDTGGADTFTVLDGNGAGIENALVMAYVKSEYDAGTFTLRGQTTTKADGTWNTNLMLNDGVEYTLVFYKPGTFGPSTATVTP